ncbi:MAG: amidohydrolase family protein [Candidatus Bathyarchaeia archaeon]
MMTMKFFDCNASLGPVSAPPPKIAKTAKDLLDEMDFCGIDEALVYHGAQMDDSPVVGNQLLIEETEGLERLHRSWAILPPQTEELPPIDQFLTLMKKYKVRALRAFPSKHRYLLNRTSFGSLFDVLVERHIPLFISVKESVGGVSDWSLIEDVLIENSDLPVVVTDHGTWGQDRYFRPLIEKYENFYIDTSRYELCGGIEAFCKKYGSDRILFGTGFPEIKIGGVLLALIHSDISTKEKEAIAHRNLEKLLRRVRF